MANEREPDDPLPVDFVPERSIATHRVSDGEDWASVAKQYNVDVHDLIDFNFHTNVPEEVNWYLRRNTGCNVSKDGGRNWAFSSSADPGLIYIPPSGIIDMGPGEFIDVRTKSTMERVQEIGKTIPGNEGIRLREMLDIAAKVGSPADTALWYYNIAAVRYYIKMHTENWERREMTKHTNGQFPFEGDATGNLGMWKETPFLEIITLDNDEYRSDSYLKTWLISLDSGIQTSWQDMVHVEDRVATGGGSAYGPLVEAFLQHVHSLAADPTHLYFVYQEH